MLDSVDYFLIKPFKIDELMMVVEGEIERFEKIKKAHNNLYCGKSTSFLDEISTPLNGILELTKLLIDNKENLKKSKSKRYIIP